MVLVKLCLRNIRNSLRDYAVYFLTLIIAVSVFYVFNAVGDQAGVLRQSADAEGVATKLSEALGAISLLVAMILGLLIVYANRFLMRRRNREFALYLLLGMGKGHVSSILVLETAVIGVASLGIGLCVGIGLSQLMGTLVAGLLEADMSDFRLGVSTGALGKTVWNFVVMFLVVTLLNRRAVTRMRLIDLMHSGERSESVRLKNPVLCVFVLLVAVLLLACAYYAVAWNARSLSGPALSFYILLGSLATLLVFWSTSGLMLRLVQRMKKTYLSGLNCFTFRQISSRANTVVFSMTVICLLLFFTICMLSTAFGVRGGLREGMLRNCPADFEVRHVEDVNSGEAPVFDDVVARYASFGLDITTGLGDYLHFHSYVDPSLRLVGAAGATDRDARAASGEANPYLLEEVVRLSDYNALMGLYGAEPLSFGEDEFVFVCDLEPCKAAFDRVLAQGATLEVFGHTLRSCSHASKDGFINLSVTSSNPGIYVVADSVVAEDAAACDYVIGNYAATDEAARRDVDAGKWREFNEFYARLEAQEDEGSLPYFSSHMFTRTAALDDALSGTALMTFVCLYLGLVFLVSCGAILSLRGLTESVDGAGRYETLRLIGASERDIYRSLFVQTAAFFIMPLALACIHAVFGMRFMMGVLAGSNMQGMVGSTVVTTLIVLVVYGGYFVATYLGSKRIIARG